MRLIFVLTFYFMCLHMFSQEEIDSLLSVLDAEMKNAHKYQEQKEKKLNTIKKIKLTAESSEYIYHLNQQLYSEYEYYNLDSTLKYIELNMQIAKKLNDNKFELESKLKMIDILCLNGRNAEALEMLSLLNRAKLPDELLIDYYAANFNIYNRILEKKKNTANLSKYILLTDSYFDSVLQVKPGKVNSRYSLIEYKYIKEKDYGKALEINSEQLNAISPDHNYFSYVTFYRATNYRQQNNIAEAKKHYAVSAISDIRQAHKNNASLTELAIMLFEEAKLERAYRYINFALEDALFYNSTYRFIRLSSVVSLINEAYQTQNSKQNKNLQLFGIITAALTILLLTGLILILRQLKNLSLARNEIRRTNLRLKDLNNQLKSSNSSLSNANTKLKEANHIKEQYIANFLSICSENIDKLDVYQKTVRKSIENRKIPELLESTKSSKLINKELDEFYKNFDSIFLKIYPLFVEQFNELLIPSEKIKLKKGELLNTELRIFALIRLGINDSSEIAELLRYSVQTIYNYRVKIKNKAKGNREELENRIMEIGANF